jgi:hypothetical protein
MYTSVYLLLALVVALILQHCFSSKCEKNANSSSRIELDESEAKLFPCLLDYVYPDSEETLIDDLAVEQLFELCHLAEYFQMPGLQKNVAPKAAGLISTENAIEFLTQAKKLQNPSFLLDEASKNLGEYHFDDISVEVASQLEPPFFLQVLNAQLGCGGYSHAAATHKLILMMACLENNQDSTLSAEVFNKLSKKVHLLDFPTTSKIYVQNVFKLLAIESRFLNTGEKSISSLQKRFLKTMIGATFTLEIRRRKLKSAFESKQAYLDQMSKLPQFFVCHLFTDSIWDDDDD